MSSGGTPRTASIAAPTRSAIAASVGVMPHGGFGAATYATLTALNGDGEA